MKKANNIYGLFIHILIILIHTIHGSADCGYHNWNRVMEKSNQRGQDHILYGITQDCQIFFARPSQIPLLSQIKSDPSNNYCFPNLISLQLIDNNNLRLLIKQSGNRVCILSINIPPLDILFGSSIFHYSLLASLPYAACSHSTPELPLETDLSFADSAYSDILYFIDSSSSGSRWNVRQFQVKPSNHLMLLDKFNIHNDEEIGETYVANKYVLSLDTDKNFLYKRNRFNRRFVYECAFDLLFRPKSVVSHNSMSMIRETNEKTSWLNSMAIDKDIMIFAETDKQSATAPTHVYIQSLKGDHSISPLCIAQLPFRVELGLVSNGTLNHLTANPLPKFEMARNSPPRPFHPRPHVPHTTPSNTLSTREETTPIQRLEPLTLTTTMEMTTIRSTTSSTTTQYIPVEPPDESEELDDDIALEFYDETEHPEIEEVRILDTSSDIMYGEQQTPTTIVSTTTKPSIVPLSTITNTGLPPNLNDTTAAETKSAPASIGIITLSLIILYYL